MSKTSKIKTRAMPSVRRLSPLAGRITTIIESARNRVQSVVDHEMVRAYWQIGREIVEDEQKGELRAEYGKALIQNLSHELTQRHGKGFTASNLLAMRRFYLTFPIQHAVRAELSWTHYRLLLKIDDPQKRSFYEIECARRRGAKSGSASGEGAC